MIKKLTVGQMSENCYLLVDSESKSALIIDPGDDAAYISGEITKLEVTPVGILATHGHFDHVMAAFELQMMYNIPFRMSAFDQFLLTRMTETAEHFLGHAVVEPPPTITSTFADNDEIRLGKLRITVMATPGHTPGSVCFYLQKEQILFSGDTIFAMGGVGRTDFSYGDKEKLYASLLRILALPDGTMIYSGHGDDTMVSKEKIYVENYR